jgi:hypothetical protein
VGVGQGRVLYLVPSSQGAHFNNFTRADLERYRIQVELLPAILKSGVGYPLAPPAKNAPAGV